MFVLLIEKKNICPLVVHTNAITIVYNESCCTKMVKKSATGKYTVLFFFHPPHFKTFSLEISKLHSLNITF